MTSLRPILACCLGLALCQGITGCAQFPDVDKAEASRLDPHRVMPRLLPVDVLLDETDFGRTDTRAAADALDGRAAALRQRADALRRFKPAE